MTRSAPARPAGAAGFTLVEILTVVAIISVLAGLTYASITAARRMADNRMTLHEITTLAQAAEAYNVAHGDYPPSTLAGLKVKSTNSVNEGNEALVLCLLGRKGGPFHEPFKDSRLQNYDNDSLSPKDFLALKRELDLPQTQPQLLEYVDTWANPFVYIHNRDYSQKTRIEYTDRDHKKVTVQAARSQKLGTFQAPTSFQIWSFGPNGQNENGEGDDIASWK